jgi:hypothetical protein
MTLSIEDAEDIVYGDHVAIQDVSKHRWYTRQLVVFERGGDLRGFYYLEPATEEQEGQDRFEGDPVPVFPVSVREVVVKTYEAAA